jgi:transcriptional regulator with XRE-family HTH domain
MKAFAVRYLAEAQRAGRTMKEVAEELRVSEPTLLAWRRGSVPPASVRERREGACVPS